MLILFGLMLSSCISAVGLSVVRLVLIIRVRRLLKCLVCWFICSVLQNSGIFLIVVSSWNWFVWLSL